MERPNLAAFPGKTCPSASKWHMRLSTTGLGIKKEATKNRLPNQWMPMYTMYLRQYLFLPIVMQLMIVLDIALAY